MVHEQARIWDWARYRVSLSFYHCHIIIIIIIIISTREVAPSAKAGINGEPQIQVTVNDNRLKIGK